jgi:hypothetical protein
MLGLLHVSALLQVRGVSERLAQLVQGVVGLALDGSDAAAQGVGGLLDREVLEVAQHEHSALAYRQSITAGSNTCCSSTSASGGA